MKPIKLGIVGACGRGASFKAAVDASGEAVIHAVCDTFEEGLEPARQRMGAAEKYADYGEMLAKSDLDAVIIGTPMPLHVPQSIAALQRGLWVLSEVPAGVNIDECRELTQTVRRAANGKGGYMMAENYTYIRQNVLVRELVRRGLFGDTYFAEAEYIHELKGLNETTPWRRKWQTGINGNTYPTHSLGPVLQWMPGQRVTSVCCAGSGGRHTDPRGAVYEQDASNLTLCRTSAGGLIKLRLDMLSDRPHSMTNYQLQGTKGCYESARAHGETDRIWLAGRAKDANTWSRLQELEDEFLPESWKQASEVAKKSGHGGGDYFEVIDFLDAIRGRRPPAIDIDAAMDMTLPGLASQISIVQGGRWVDVPDSRTWTADYVHLDGQLFMRWPEGKPAPEVVLPEGYILRQFNSADTAAYRGLMEKAGFGTWDDGRIRSTFERTLEGGMFLVEHRASAAVVATALANPAPTSRYPHGGELGWVAGDPAHAGKGLGKAVCAAVVRLFQSRGYRTIYLSTDDWRLPAVRIYLGMGFTPDLYKDDMPARWEAVRAQLQQPRA